MRISLFFLFLVFIFSGCSSKQSAIPVADLKNYSQDSSAYAINIQSQNRLLEVQKEYKEHYFKPWNIAQVPISKLEAMWALNHYKAGTSYGENLLLINENWFQKVKAASNFDAFGSVNSYAISLHFTHLRVFPTHKPLFSDPNKAGEGFPFDYMQNSGIHSNEPLFVSHYSKDGAWVYIFTSYASGWVRHRDIALLSSQEIQNYQQNKFLHVNREYTPMKQDNGSFVTYGRVGMMLPFVDENSTHYRVLVHNGRSFVEASLPLASANTKQLLLNRKNLVALTNELMGRKYGWGGMYEERDCSSTLRDIFSSFGIWLPRNSSKQSSIGRVISLEGLSDAEKIKRIKDEAVPYETILYRRGHVLLYLGSYKDEIMVFHDTWGIRTNDDGVEGRKIIGKTIISTLKLGSEQPNYNEKYEHLKNLKSMNIITQQ